MALVFENQTSDGYSELINHSGGVLQIQIAGAFDGAAIETEVSQDLLPFHSQSNGNQSQPTTYKITLKAACRLRFRLTGAGGATDISVSVL